MQILETVNGFELYQSEGSNRVNVRKTSTKKFQRGFKTIEEARFWASNQKGPKRNLI